MINVKSAGEPGYREFCHQNQYPSHSVLGRHQVSWRPVLQTELEDKLLKRFLGVFSSFCVRWCILSCPRTEKSADFWSVSFSPWCFRGVLWCRRSDLQHRLHWQSRATCKTAVPWESVQLWFPTSGRDPNQGRRGSDVESREGFMENSIVIQKKSKFEQNDRKNLCQVSICPINYKFIPF